MAESIQIASAQDTRYFTRPQWAGVLARQRRTRRKAGGCVVGCLGGGLGLAVFIAVTVLSAGLSTPIALAAVLVVVLLGFAIRMVHRRQRAVDLAALDGWLDRWMSHGSIERLIHRPVLGEAPPAPPEPDIYDYGVERILVVQHDLMVDLLVKNGDHAELRALVLSESGYPSYHVDLARKLLLERPTLPVVLLHDATGKGAAMHQRLAKAGLLPIGGRVVTDAGLFPDQVRSLGDIMPGVSANDVRAEHLPPGVLRQGLVAVTGGALFGPALVAAHQPTGGASARASRLVEERRDAPDENPLLRL